MLTDVEVKVNKNALPWNWSFNLNTGLNILQNSLVGNAEQLSCILGCDRIY